MNGDLLGEPSSNDNGNGNGNGNDHLHAQQQQQQPMLEGHASAAAAAPAIDLLGGSPKKTQQTIAPAAPVATTTVDTTFTTTFTPPSLEEQPMTATATATPTVVPVPVPTQGANLNELVVVPTTKEDGTNSKTSPTVLEQNDDKLKESSRSDDDDDDDDDTKQNNDYDDAGHETPSASSAGGDPSLLAEEKGTSATSASTSEQLEETTTTGNANNDKHKHPPPPSPNTNTASASSPLPPPPPSKTSTSPSFEALNASDSGPKQEEINTPTLVVLPPQQQQQQQQQTATSGGANTNTDTDTKASPGDRATSGQNPPTTTTTPARNDVSDGATTGNQQGTLPTTSTPPLLVVTTPNHSSKPPGQNPPTTTTTPARNDASDEATGNQQGTLPTTSTPPLLVVTTPNHPSKPPGNAPDTSPLPQQQQRLEGMEKELHAAHSLILKLQHQRDEKEQTTAADAIIMVELQANLQSQMTKRAEAEDTARLATAQAKKFHQQLETLQKTYKATSSTLKGDLTKVSLEKSEIVAAFETIKEERDEQARKEASLTTRLNAAKKKEAVKANAAEHYEDRVELLEKHVDQYKQELTSVTAERDQFKKEVAEWKHYAEQRTKQLENALADEKKLNDERKRKMKGFVEAKTEEVRSVKADNISLQTELDQTNQSLKELNQRYKQLHAQWVQSQTRNREVQRDMTKVKKDSEKMSKVGGTLEAKLSRSAQETEDHKSKRLTAKNELMAVLARLEAEREVNNRLRESIKDTFTLKALSQQQTIQETLDDFEAALQKLATRLRRQLAPPPVTGNDLLLEMMSEQTLGDGATSEDHGVGESNKPNASDINTARVLSKLESETQRVSQCIMSFTTSVERMHELLDGSGARSCVDALQDMLLVRHAASTDETAAMTGNRRRSRGARYGQIPGTLT